MAAMVSGNTIAEVASLIGDVARANILSALMDGRAFTAGELTWHAGVGAPTTSAHLSKLMQANLIVLQKQGRHRYYRLASPEVAHAIEALMAVAVNGPKRYRPAGPKDEAMRAARTCYDHMAGRLGVGIADALSARGYVVLADGTGILTDGGRSFLNDFGVAIDDRPPSARPLCRTCIDWSERRPHLAGRLGAALLERMLALGWVSCIPHTRALRVTPAGMRGFVTRFGVPAERLARTSAP